MNRTNQKDFFLSLDTKKAFDRVAWDYMKAVLEKIALGWTMLNFISALYSSPSAKVWANGHLSNYLIYELSLEPLLRHIRVNENM